MAIRVGINGFGRIGRMFFRAVHQYGDDDLEVVGFNDLMDPETAAHLLRYDSVHGRYPGTVEVRDDRLVVDGVDLVINSERDPAKLPWKDQNVDLVIESTGLFTKRDDAAKHLEAGAKKVIISAPAKQEDITVIVGANHEDYDPATHDVVSIASCTTNSVVPLVKVLDDSLGGITQGYMTTVHAYTNDQALHDQPHKDLRRARAGALSTIPTTTGAARATSLALPHLQGKLDGVALRVPVPDGSITDFVCNVGRDTSVDEVNDAFRQAAQGPLQGILEYATDPLVSTDIIGNPASCVFDSLATMVNGSMVKVFGWYDNEWGFSCRLVDMARHVGQRL